MKAAFSSEASLYHFFPDGRMPARHGQKTGIPDSAEVLAPTLMS
jgi:hypothetical protein